MKEKKYKYEWTVEETTTDTRVWTVRANKKLTDEELQELACSTEQVPGGINEEDEEKIKEFKISEENLVDVIYEETIYGDDAQWDYTLHTTTASIEDELNAKERLIKILKVKDKGETNA